MPAEAGSLDLLRLAPVALRNASNNDLPDFTALHSHCPGASPNSERDRRSGEFLSASGAVLQSRRMIDASHVQYAFRKYSLQIH
jgi:hypothetical protein